MMLARTSNWKAPGSPILHETGDRSHHHQLHIEKEMLAFIVLRLKVTLTVDQKREA